MAETEESLLSPSADTYQLVPPPVMLLLLPCSRTMHGNQSDAVVRSLLAESQLVQRVCFPVCALTLYHRSQKPPPVSTATFKRDFPSPDSRMTIKAARRKLSRRSLTGMVHLSVVLFHSRLFLRPPPSPPHIHSFAQVMNTGVSVGTVSSARCQRNS